MLLQKVPVYRSHRAKLSLGRKSVVGHATGQCCSCTSVKSQNSVFNCTQCPSASPLTNITITNIPQVQWELRWVTLNIFWEHVSNDFRTLFKNRSVHFSIAPSLSVLHVFFFLISDVLTSCLKHSFPILSNTIICRQL